MAQFRIDYSKVIAQANSMNDLSRELDSQIRALEWLLSKVRSEWFGPASRAYQNQLVMLISDMKSTESKLSSISSTIRSVAGRIQSEDETLIGKT